MWQAGCLHGSGASLRVLLAACQHMGWVWFSHTYGAFNDTLVAVGVDPQVAATLPCVSYPRHGPLARASTDPSTLEEYRITATLLRCLDCEPETDGANGWLERGCMALLEHGDRRLGVVLSLHDDCFFTLRPVTPRLLSATLEAILDMHSFWMGREVEWATTAEWLAGQLERHRTLRLESANGPERLVVSWPQRTGLLTRLVKRRIAENIPIVEGRAQPPL